MHMEEFSPFPPRETTRDFLFALLHDKSLQGSGLLLIERLLVFAFCGVRSVSTLFAQTF